MGIQKALEAQGGDDGLAVLAWEQHEGLLAATQRQKIKNP